MLTYAWKELADSFPLKAVLSIVLVAVGKQALLFMAFLTLVFLDCFTRWTAISAERLRKEGKPAGLMAAIRHMPVARRAGLISSAVMKERGTEKLILYALCVMVGAGADCLLALDGAAPGLSRLAIGYLGLTEALSIIENLSDAGVKGMEELAMMLKRRK